MEVRDWLLTLHQKRIVLLFVALELSWFVVHVKMQKGELKFKYLLLLFIKTYLFRVKYYCSICYPNIDRLTDSQLKRMKRCRHSKIFLNIIKQKKNLTTALIIVLDDAAQDVSLAGSQISMGKDKNKSNIM